MIASEEMRKLIVIGPKGVLRKTIATLYHLKACHIQDHAKDETFDIGSPLDNAAHLSEMLVRVRSLLAHLGLEGQKSKEGTATAHQIDAHTKKVAEEVNALVGEKRMVEMQLSALSGKKAKAAHLRVDVPVESFFALKSLKGYCGTIPMQQEDVMKRALGGDVQVYESAPAESDRFICLFVKPESAADVGEILSSHGFVALDIKELEGYEGSPKSIEERLSSEILKLEKKLTHIINELKGHAKRNKEFLLSAEALLREELLKAEAPLRFGSTKGIFFVTGWVPAGRVEEATKALTKAAQGKIHIEVEKPMHDEDVPVKLNNPAPVDSFESLVRLFSWPKYGEVDPSAFMAFTLPLFFGMMLGDIGYGIVTLVVFAIMRKKFQIFAPFFTVLILASVSTIIFGFLFGELFGLEEVFGYHLWHVLSRAHDVSTLGYHPAHSRNSPARRL